jgi:hypothetical protein
MTTTTDKQATAEYLIRALYAAKAEFKDAASDLYSAQHNLHCLASTSASEAELSAARAKRKTEEVRYAAAERAYDSIAAVCQKLQVI